MNELLSEVLRSKLEAHQNSLLFSSSDSKINILGQFSNIYKHLLTRNPDYWLWLNQPETEEPFRYSNFQELWERTLQESKPSSKDGFIKAMQRFRRKMSMRIAYRIVNHLGSLEQHLNEQSWLADFCIRVLCYYLKDFWVKNLGEPWNKAANRKSKFCVLGFGKLGAGELNFFSDIDLIYVYENEGFCRKSKEVSELTNKEFFTRFFQDLTVALSRRSSEGFMYNVDLRLRPDGEHGPIAYSLSALENYYSTRGQTWERLVLMKARPVGGDNSVGEELLDDLNSFRYPRSVPVRVLGEITGIKLRTEQEVVGQNNLSWDIKNGYGGIREVEFILQGLQLVHAGKNPFLQTPSVYEALQKLTRYGQLPSDKGRILNKAYDSFRMIENYLQLKDEKQVYCLPEDDEERALLANNLGYESLEVFDTSVQEMRHQVHTLYKEFLPKSSTEAVFQEWFSFLSGNEPSESIRSQLESWMPVNDQTYQQIRAFVLGGSGHFLTRNHVRQFINLSHNFETVLPPLAQPIETLLKVGTFGESYGARSQFLQMCSLNPNFLKVLTLLFDRSEFIYKLLCRHPEIIEELLLLPPKQEKELEEIEQEIQHLPQGESFSKYLWLYVKAEQVRIAIWELLHAFTPEEVEKQLTLLAEGVLNFTLKKAKLNTDVCIIGLGKFGGKEITFGSDLDILVLGNSEGLEDTIAGVKKWEELLRYKHPLGRTYEIDLRLKPHGEDSPIVTTLESFMIYHEKEARTWEKQILTRKRYICGNKELADSFFKYVHSRIYSKPATLEELKAIQSMRHTIQSIKNPMYDSSYAYKTASGSILTIEFYAQSLQLLYGYKHKELKTTPTRDLLQLVAKLELQDAAAIGTLLENYNFLRRLELYLRRYENRMVTFIEKSPNKQAILAYWLGFKDFESFWQEYLRRLEANIGIIDTHITSIIKDLELKG